MAIHGNAFALLDDDVDAETVLARLSNAAVESPDKRKAINKKSVTSSHSSSSSLSQSSTTAPQRSSVHEKGRPAANKNGFEQRQTKTIGKGYNNRDGDRNRVESNGGAVYKRNNAYRHDERPAADGLKPNAGQTKAFGKGYDNRDGVVRHNRYRVEANVCQENGSQQNTNHGGAVIKRNNGYRHDERRPAANGLNQNAGKSNGYHYHKKPETSTDGPQKKQEVTEKESSTDAPQKKQEITENKEEIDKDGWQVVRRSKSSNNGHKQNIVNGNGSEAKVLGDKQHQDESGEKSADGKDVNENRIKNGGNGRSNRGRNWPRGERRTPPSTAEGEENGKSAVFLNEKEVRKGSGDDASAGPEGDETASKASSGKQDKGPSPWEIERLERQKEWELEAKRKTLKQYEEEKKSKALESLKTEERKVALDKELESMHMIGRKNEVKQQENHGNDKLKKKPKAVNSKGDSNAPEELKTQLFFRRPTGKRGGRYQNRNGTSDAKQFQAPSEGAVQIPAIPLEDAMQFPALVTSEGAVEIPVEEPVVTLPPSIKVSKQFPANYFWADIHD